MITAKDEKVWTVGSLELFRNGLLAGVYSVKIDHAIQVARKLDFGFRTGR